MEYQRDAINSVCASLEQTSRWGRTVTYSEAPALVDLLIREAKRDREANHDLVVKLDMMQNRHAAEMKRIHDKLEQGTLHILYCNDDRESRVGREGTICCCTLGKEIKRLRKAVRTFVNCCYEWKVDNGEFDYAKVPERIFQAAAEALQPRGDG